MFHVVTKPVSRDYNNGTCMSDYRRGLDWELDFLNSYRT
jgi:hypothetical protein